jgi:hypothetical protein
LIIAEMIDDISRETLGRIRSDVAPEFDADLLTSVHARELLPQLRAIGGVFSDSAWFAPGAERDRARVQERAVRVPRAVRRRQLINLIIAEMNKLMNDEISRRTLGRTQSDVELEYDADLLTSAQADARLARELLPQLCARGLRVLRAAGAERVGRDRARVQERAVRVPRAVRRRALPRGAVEVRRDVEVHLVRLVLERERT